MSHYNNKKNSANDFDYEFNVKKAITILWRGITSARYSKIKRCIYTIVTILLILFWIDNRTLLLDKPFIYDILWGCSSCMAALIIIYLGGLIVPGGYAENSFHRIGFVNAAKEAPYLIRYHRPSHDKRIIIYEFYSEGLSLIEWRKKVAQIETALNRTILDISQGKNKKRILVTAISAKTALPDFIKWEDKYLREKDFQLVLGESLMGLKTIDLNKIPHILIGGSTGSGKTVLLKGLLYQCIKKGAVIFIADFKGGVDFSKKWSERVTIITEKQKLLKILTHLTNVIEQRKLLFSEYDCSNIVEYNKAAKDSIKRIIFACDEVAELLDKTGLSKSEKELVLEIEKNLSIIARQGRAFGVHLMIGTQRPDATILSGQIKNNIDCRICGRADDILSRIILDNTDASEKIGKQEQGRFLLNDGTLIQSFFFNDFH